MFDQITILGPGLLGASIALAVKKRGIAKSVHVWSRRATTREKCEQTDWCDAVFDTPQAAVDGSSLTIICTPVATITPLLTQIADSLAGNALVTDVGSTKGLICQEAGPALSGHAQFIGSHPMAGSEQTGMEFASATLLQGATCLMTPLPDASAKACEQLAAFWQALGMRITCLSPQEHDRIVAHISHLPHLLASTLCNYLAEKEPEWGNYAGGGLRDSTRVAAGDPELWQQILAHNQAEVLNAIDGFQTELDRLKSVLLNQDSDSIKRFLENGKKYRDGLYSTEIH